jgi:cytochrome c556
MTEMLIEYDENNKTVKQVLNAMISSGVIHKKRTAKEKRIAEFKQALKETKEMADNIAAGKNDYETMDEFLKRL